MHAETMNWIAVLASTGGAVAGLIGWQRLRAAWAEGAGPHDDRPVGLLRLVASPLAQRLRPEAQADLEQLQTTLLRAARRGRHDVDRFLEEKVLFMVGGVTAGLLLASLAGGGGGLLLLVTCSLLGLLLPERRLRSAGARRRDAVSAGLPGAVDLLVTCLDAGLSLEQAIARVAKDLAHSSPVLAEELHITASEFEAGVSLPDALRRLARRVGLDDLSAMCGVVAQAHALGAPIAHTLREYAIASRRQRMSILEERAGKLSTQLTIPLALFLLPAAMLIILGPAALQLVRALK